MYTRLSIQTALAVMVCLLLVLSGCSKKSTGDDEVITDGSAPSPVTDLTVIAFTDTSITLQWTASGDDSTVGTATAYNLRWSYAAIHWGNFDSAQEVTGLPIPQAAGETEQYRIGGLTAESTYYFALQVLDEIGNYQGCSNCAHATCFTDYPVSFPDPALRTAIRSAIGKPTGDILKSDIRDLADLGLDDLGISDLTGLEECENLINVNMINNNVSDLTPLSGLVHLYQINGSMNDITDLSPLASLTGLRRLYIRINDVSNLNPIASLTGLKELDLQENAISDISALQNLTALENLNLAYNRVTDIEPLVDNTGFGSGDVVTLNGNPLEHESIMNHIPTLRARGATVAWTDNTLEPAAIPDLTVDSIGATSVRLTWTAPGEDYMTGRAYRYELRYSSTRSDIENWTGGTAATGLPDPDTAGTMQSFTVDGLSEDTTYYFGIKTEDNSENWSPVSNVVWAQPFNDIVVTFPDAALEAAIRSALSKPSGDIVRSDLLDLDSLLAVSLGITNLSGLEYCLNLTRLNLQSNNITDISPLAGLYSMFDLNLSGNNIADISPLSDMNGLFALQLSSNPVGDLSDLSSLTTIAFLALTFVGTDDISPLASLTEVRYLFISGNGISDISALASMTHLTYLSADYNSIDDLTPLQNLVEISQVSFGHNSIVDIGPLVNNVGIGSGDQIGLTYNPLSDTSINTYIPALQARGVTVTW